MIEDDDVDIEEFLATIHGNKPPYECPFSSCRKIFRSYPAIQKHMESIHKKSQELEICELDIVNDENKNPSNSDISQMKRTSKIVTESVQLSYADSKKFVTLHNERRNFRCNINLPMSIEHIVEIPSVEEVLDKSIVSENLFPSAQSANVSFSKSIVEENSNDTHPSDLSSSIMKKKSYKRKRSYSVRSFRKIRKLNTNDQSLSNIETAADSSTKDIIKPTIPVPVFREDEQFVECNKSIPAQSDSYVHFVEKSAEELNEIVEYDLDEEDLFWLPICNQYMSTISTTKKISKKSTSNKSMKKNKGIIIGKEIMEYVMDRFEKECHFESSNTKIDEDAVCDICLDGSCENSNAILFCDVCNLAVHQECYGVPFVPEGQWLCRKCLHSPSQSVDCCLCPNKGGAFKQTNDNRWSHVVCALWIPEVRFANLIFLEPIEDIEKIESARWRLTCYLCKQKNVGACIQCHKSNCYTAFHVTCAQHAGLYMLIQQKDRVNGGANGVRKTTYCDIHSPADYVPGISRAMYANSDEDNYTIDKSESRQKHLKDVRKLLTQRQSYTPPACFPIITPDKLKGISDNIDVPHKNSFMERIHAYWTLKRELKRGVPLLRRLVASSKSNLSSLPLDDENPEMRSSLKFWQQLRQDLEKARLLSELSRKREKLKRELFRNFINIHRLLMRPASFILTSLINNLQALDKGKIFVEPVTDLIAPNYSNLIKHPMDFSTMRKKLNDTGEYVNIDQVKSDFNLMIANCQKYNAKNTVFYNVSVKLMNESKTIFEKFEKHYNEVGLDKTNGTFINKMIYELVINDVDDSEDNDIINKLETEISKISPILESVSIVSEPSDESTRDTVSSSKQKKRKPSIAVSENQSLELRKRKYSSNSIKEDLYSFRNRRCSTDTTTKSPTPPITPIDVDVSSNSQFDRNHLLASNTLSNNHSSYISSRLRKMPATSSSAINSIITSSSSSSQIKTRNQYNATQNNNSNNNNGINNMHSNENTISSCSNTSQEDNLIHSRNINRVSSSCTDVPDSSTNIVSNFKRNNRPQRTPSQVRITRTNSRSSRSNLPDDKDNGEREHYDSMYSDSNNDIASFEHQSEGNSRTEWVSSYQFRPWDAVWAKSQKGTWYPGLIVDPVNRYNNKNNSVKNDRNGLPVPPQEILETANNKKNHSESDFLIMLFDKKRKWCWMSSRNVELLSVNEQLDRKMLQQLGKSPRNVAIQNGYRSAVKFICQHKNQDYPYELNNSNNENIQPFILKNHNS